MDYATQRAIACSGVSLAYLVEFKGVIEEDRNSSMSSAEVCATYIHPVTQPKRCHFLGRGADVMPPEHVGRPVYYISHTWSDNFCDMVTSVASHLRGMDPTTTFVWLDLFAVNHHAPRTEAALDTALASMEATIRTASGGVLGVLGRTGAALRRLWCLLEMWTALSVRGTGALAMLLAPNLPPSTSRDLPDWVQPLDVGAAGAPTPQEKARLLDWVMAYGGPDQLTTSLQLFMLLSPPDPLADMQFFMHASSGGASKPPSSWIPSRPFAQLRDRGLQASSPPSMDAYARWLGLAPSAPGYRMLLLQGPPGSGKSTACAAMCATGATPPAAALFCSGRDTRKTSAVQLVKSLAYQLAQVLPGFSAALMPTLDAASIRKLATPGDAVGMLLSRPLSTLTPPTTHALSPALKSSTPSDANRPSAAQLGGAGGAGVHGRTQLPPVIDPRAGRGPGGSLVPGKARVGGVSMSGRPVVGAAHPPPIPAHGLVLLLDGVDAALGHRGGEAQSALRDQVMLLLREHLLALPPWVRFVVSTAPAGLSREVSLCLATRCVPRLMAPTDMLSARELQMVFVQQLSPTVPDPRMALSFVRHMLGVTGTNLLHARLVVMGVLARHAAYVSAGNPDVGTQAAGTAPSAHLVALCPVIPSTLHDTVAWLLAGALPQGLESEPQLMALLQVLAAAREPLLLSQLHAVGVADALPSLPCWGTLFHVRDGAVYALHSEVLVALPTLTSSDLARWTSKPSSRRRTPAASGRPDSTMAAAPLGGASQQAAGHAASIPSPAQLVRPSSSPRVGTAASSVAPSVAAPSEMSPPATPGPLLDVGAGHAALAAMCEAHLGEEVGAWRRYALRHTPYHLASAGRDEAVEALAGDPGYWEAAYRAGVGREVVSDLVELAPQSSAVLQDILRWCRVAAPALSQHPHAVWQLARDAPVGSVVRSAAASRGVEIRAWRVGVHPGWPPLIMTLGGRAGEGGGVTCVSFPPTPSPAHHTAHLLASGCRDGAVRLWDTRTGALCSTLQGHAGAVDMVRFCSATAGPHGEALLASYSSADARMCLWDVAAACEVAAVTGMAPTMVPSQTQFRTVGYHDFPASNRRFIGRLHVDGGVIVYEITPEANKVLAKMHPELDRYIGGAREFKVIVESLTHTQVECGALAPSRQCVATGSGGGVSLWDVAALQQCDEHPAEMTRLATRGTLLRNGLWDHALVMAHYEAACAEVDAECEEGLAADSATGINTFQARQEDVKGTEDTARTDIPPPAQCVPSPAAQPPADSSNTLSTASREHSGRVTAPVVAVAVQDSLDPARVESLLGRSLLAKLVPLPSSPADEVNVIRVSPDGALLATGGTRGVLRVWAAHPAPPGATFTPRRLPRNSSSMRAAPLVWAPGTPPVGAGATSLGAGSSTRWQEGSRGACSALLAELHGHVAPITAITFLHGPRIMLVTGGADESLRMWDLSALLAPESSPDAVPHILTLPPPGSNPLPLPPSPSQLWSDGHNEQHHRQQYCDRQHNISARQHQEMTPGGEDNDSGSTSMEDPDVLGDVPSSGRKAAVGWVQEPATFLPPVSPSNQADARVQTGENADLVRQSYRTGSLHRLRNARELASVGRATYAGATVLRPPNIAPHLHTTPRVVPPSPSALERAHAFDHIANTITDRREGVLGVRPANPLVAVLAGHEGTITALDASPDGLQFASGSTDSSVRLWRAKGRVWAQRAVLRGVHAGPITSLAFAPLPPNVSRTHALDLMDPTASTTSPYALLASGSSPSVMRGGASVCVWAVATCQLLFVLPTFSLVAWSWVPRQAAHSHVYPLYFHSQTGSKQKDEQLGHASSTEESLCLVAASESSARVMVMPEASQGVRMEPELGSSGKQAISSAEMTVAVRAGATLVGVADVYFLQRVQSIAVVGDGYIATADHQSAALYKVTTLTSPSGDISSPIRTSSTVQRADNDVSTQVKSGVEAISSAPFGAYVQSFQQGNDEAHEAMLPWANIEGEHSMWGDESGGGQGSTSDEGNNDLESRLADLHFLDAWRLAGARSNTR